MFAIRNWLALHSCFLHSADRKTGRAWRVQTVLTPLASWPGRKRPFELPRSSRTLTDSTMPRSWQARFSEPAEMDNLPGPNPKRA